MKSQMQTAYTDLIEWFCWKRFELLDDATDEEYERILGSIVQNIG
jgi:magnesium chelatase subunit I